jgi:hypothetical protein
MSRRTVHQLVTAGVVALIPSPAADACGSEPALAIFLEGGVGLIRADRVWEEDGRLCWESQGLRSCLPEDPVQSPAGTEAQETPENAPTDTTPAAQR